MKRRELAKELKMFGKFGGARIQRCTCLQIEGPKIWRQALGDRDYLTMTSHLYCMVVVCQIHRNVQ